MASLKPLLRRSAPLTRRLLWLGLVALLVLGGLAWQLGGGRPRPVNVVLITIDTQRADRLSCYHRHANPTPKIDRLASQGAIYINAFCDVTWTTPSMSSVMTGTYATRHGMRSTYQQLDPANVTLAEYLQERGYQTAAIIGSFPLAASFGLNQGFDTYDDRFTAPIIVGGKDAGAHVEQKFSRNLEEQRLYQWVKSQADAYRPDNEVSDAAIAWLRDRKPGLFFLWVHYFGPHELGDLRLTPEEQDAKTIEVYDGDVRRTDREVGRFLDAMSELGLDDDTLTILHADHGQSLGEHLYVGHGKNLYDPTLRIPLIVRLPGVVPAGSVVPDLARNVDIVPTVLETLGIKPVAPLDGASLSRLGYTGGTGQTLEMYAETYLSATDAFATEIPNEQGDVTRVGFRRLGLLRGRWKLVVNEPWPLLDYASSPPVPEAILKEHTTVELYDLSANPLELKRGKIIDRPEVVADLRARIDAYNAVPTHGGTHRDLDEDAKKRLRSLGYLH